MTATLLGVCKMQGTSKKTGKPYDGYMFHLGYVDEHIQGTATAQMYVDSSVIEKTDTPIKIGSTYDFNYEVNFSGYQRLATVEIC